MHMPAGISCLMISSPDCTVQYTIVPVPVVGGSGGGDIEQMPRSYNIIWWIGRYHRYFTFILYGG